MLAPVLWSSTVAELALQSPSHTYFLDTYTYTHTHTLNYTHTHTYTQLTTYFHEHVMDFSLVLWKMLIASSTFKPDAFAVPNVSYGNEI